LAAAAAAGAKAAAGAPGAAPARKPADPAAIEPDRDYFKEAVTALKVAIGHFPAGHFILCMDP
jgi:hypothetical protein